MGGHASGVYFYELRVAGPGGVQYREARKFVLVK
jgi:hypothetical protein